MNQPIDASLLAAPERDLPQRNQAWLSQRFAHWAERLIAGPESTAADGLDDGPWEGGFEPVVWPLARRFGLSSFERELLILTAGIEVDANLRAALAMRQGTAANEPLRLSFASALAFVPQAHWDALSPLGPLRHWSMLDVDTARGLLEARLRLDERMLHQLTCVAAIDERLLGIAEFDEGPPGEHPQADVIAVDMDTVPRPLVWLAPADRDTPAAHREGRALARAICARLDRRLLWVDHQTLATMSPRELAANARSVDREAGLVGAVIGVALGSDSAPASQLGRFVAALRSPLIGVGPWDAGELGDLRGRTVLGYDIASSASHVPSSVPDSLRPTASAALRQFRVGAGVVEQALGSIDFQRPDIDASALFWTKLRTAARGGLDTLAQRIESRATFADLVLPPLVTAQLREIAGQLRLRDTVFDAWGFGDGQSHGLGIAALFAGESGTGKTLAAQAIANEAGLDLYRIDLAQLVSKYIGETEKNLARLFAAAESSGAVLLFDEADALFGKRSEVKDSHDRYANIEVAYLLQRIESYRGLAILTTNLKSSLDRAFLRRLRFVVNFPFPDEAARGRIWQRQFPQRAPIAGLDCDALARWQLSGGHIRTVALNAAFRAAARGGAIGHGDVVAAARAEFAKLERVLTEPQQGASR